MIIIGNFGKMPKEMSVNRDFKPAAILPYIFWKPFRKGSERLNRSMERVR